VKLWYYTVTQNFGDALNGWMWPRVLPDFFDNDDDEIFVGFGTVLTNNILDGVPPTSPKHVFGAGAGYNINPAELELDDTWHFHFLRGPKTTADLRLPPETAITDGAMLVSRFVQRDDKPKYRASIMLHQEVLQHYDRWDDVCKPLGINVIHPWTPVEQALQEIAASQVVFAEAMHLAIVADAIGVPWVPIKVYPWVLDYKWQDWCSSMGLQYEPHHIQPLWRVEGRGIKSALKKLVYPIKVRAVRDALRQLMDVQPCLSEREHLKGCVDAMLSRCQDFASARGGKLGEGLT